VIPLARLALIDGICLSDDAYEERVVNYLVFLEELCISFDDPQ